MTARSVFVAVALAVSGLALSARAEDGPAAPTPLPPQDGTPAPTASPTPHHRDGWYRPGTNRHWGDGTQYSEYAEDEKDPNQDSIFIFPTGRTLRRGQLSLGFPGAGGAPDIQYGLTDFLQIGAGYTLFGFTPAARLGLIRGRRVDFTLVGGAYLPAGSTHPFYGQYGGGILSAGREEFRVHLGYFAMQGWGSPFPDVNSVTGGLGETGVEIKMAPRAKFLFMIENFAQLQSDKDKAATPGQKPVYAIAVSPGVRIWSNNLSADVGFIAGEVYNVKLKRTDAPSDKAFVLPMLTLRYQL